MTAPIPLSRRRLTGALLSLPVLLAACVDQGGPPVATSFAPLRYDYLTKLRLNVGAISVNDSWVPSGGAVEVGYLSPVPPLDALRQMALDRLLPGGASGRAVFVIDNAAMTRDETGYRGTFAVHLDVLTSDGTRSGFAEAHVSRSRSPLEGDTARERAALYDLTRQMMDDMNVEFEYQVKRTLRDYLQATAPGIPSPGPVQTQDLGPPGTSPAPPPPAPSSPAPPPPAPSSPAPSSPAPSSPAPPLPASPPPPAPPPTDVPPSGATPLAPPGS